MTYCWTTEKMLLLLLLLPLWFCAVRAVKAFHHRRLYHQEVLQWLKWKQSIRL